jgi:SAM-dependent methyltransferase
MKPRLLDLVRCPRCHGAFRVESFVDAPVPGAPSEREIEEGALACVGCGKRFPIIAGVPRLIAPALLAQIGRRYPEFFAHHPELAPPAEPPADPLADTLESFTRQRLDLRPPGPEFARQWRAHLGRNLGAALPVEGLAGKLVLDVGCGFGRHLFVASEAGAEVVGVDLSGGVDVARANNRLHPRCHVVQANVHERPFCEDTFDVVWSFGVLHHMPDPRAGFRAIVPVARANGGVVVVWVYGYRGMAFTYRLSHMRPLHRALRSLSGPARVRASRAVAAMLTGLYWGPLWGLKRLGLARRVERLPLADYVDHGWSARVAAVHDRLSTPITHFHDRDELRGWFDEAGLRAVSVEDTDRRGWRAHGVRGTEAGDRVAIQDSAGRAHPAATSAG